MTKLVAGPTKETLNSTRGLGASSPICATPPKMQRLFESLGRALLLGVLGIIVGSLFYWVHPLFGGMALLATIILVFIFVFEGATQASEEIAQRLVHRKARR